MPEFRLYSPPANRDILPRYRILQTGSVKDLAPDKPWLTEIGPVDPDHDDVFEVWTQTRVHYRTFSDAERERQALKRLGRQSDPASAPSPR